MLVETKPNTTLYVEGPASVELLEGHGTIFGADFEKGQRIIVPEGKAIAIYSENALKIDAKIGDKGLLQEFEGTTIPPYWDNLVEAIKAKQKELNRAPVVLFIGDVDTGKTTLITYILNKLVKQGLKVGIIDADIGQSDVGPPTTIGYSTATYTVFSLTNLKPERCFFVGTTSPVGLFHRHITGLLKVLEYAKMQDTCAILIDTTGWVHTSFGRELKTIKTLTINPDILVLIEKNSHELDFLEKVLGSIVKKIIKIKAPQRVTRRSREVRRDFRTRHYRRYLVNAEIKDIDMNSIFFGYAYLGNGEDVTNTEIAQIVAEEAKISGISYMELGPDFALIVTKKSIVGLDQKIRRLQEVLENREIKIFPESAFHNILVGLVDDDWNLLGIGILHKIDFTNKKVKIFTHIPQEVIKGILFGSIKVNQDGEELGKIRHWTF